MLKKKTISVTEEKRIVLGLIVSTDFFKSIQDTLQLKYFKNNYLKTVASWCKIWFEQYNKAPYLHIQDIFDAESNELKETDSELIEKLISSLSEQYDSENINVQYLSDMALDYFRQREVEILINNITVLKEDGDLEGAEEALESFKKITTAIDYSVILNPGNLEQQEEIYELREKQDRHFFKLPGDLGRYLGNHKRGDVVGYYGPAKRGKTVAADTLIYLADGTLKTIKEVVDKKITNILCMSKKHKIVKGEINNWLYSGIKREHTITTKAGRKIITSKDHRFYTPNGWKKLCELKVGDTIAMAKKISPKCNLSVPKSELKTLAYLIADGHMGSGGVGFTKLDNEIMDDFEKYANLLNGVVSYHRAPGRINFHRKSSIFKLLKKIGLFGKLSGTKFIPDYIMQSNLKCLKTFLATLFTCDGSIWKDRNCVVIDYCTKSPLLAEQILYCLSRFGIFGKLEYRKVKKQIYYEIIISSNISIKNFMKNIGFTFSKQKKAKKLCTNLSCKRDYIDIIPHKFVKAVGDKLKSEGQSVSSNETFRYAYVNNKHLSRYTFGLVAGLKHPVLSNDILWDRISSIKKGKKSPMYDLSIKDDHNFIANSFVVHNSFTLINNFKHAVAQKRKTLFWSIEMTKTEVLPRVNKSFYPMINDDSDYYTYPAFDCIHNQTGDCRKRNSPVAVLDGDEMIPDPNHIVCTKCMRHSKAKVRKKYRMTVYQKSVYRETDDIFAVREQHKMFKGLWDAYGRISVHKKYSLSYDAMMRDLDALVNKENFIPDILIIDYIDILITNSNFDDYRLEDEKWKLLAKIAGEMNALVITGTQANKAGHTTDILSAEHQGGYYGKNRHVNLMVGLNQKPEEKELGLMRFGITEAREIEFIPGRTCAVLQDFKTGQAYLDSYYK